MDRIVASFGVPGDAKLVIGDGRFVETVGTENVASVLVDAKVLATGIVEPKGVAGDWLGLGAEVGHVVADVLAKGIVVAEWSVVLPHVADQRCRNRLVVVRRVGAGGDLGDDLVRGDCPDPVDVGELDDIADR